MIQRSTLVQLLAAFSGMFELAYERFFIRLFSNYFGDSFIITGLTLCAIFLGTPQYLCFIKHRQRYLSVVKTWQQIKISFLNAEKERVESEISLIGFTKA